MNKFIKWLPFIGAASTAIGVWVGIYLKKDEIWARCCSPPKPKNWPLANSNELSEAFGTWAIVDGGVRRLTVRPGLNFYDSELGSGRFLNIGSEIYKFLYDTKGECFYRFEIMDNNRIVMHLAKGNPGCLSGEAKKS